MGGTSSSKLNKSTSFFAGVVGSSFLAVDLLGTELLGGGGGALAPPSSNSSYSSNCALLEGRSWKSLPPEYPPPENPPPSPTRQHWSRHQGCGGGEETIDLSGIRSIRKILGAESTVFLACATESSFIASNAGILTFRRLCFSAFRANLLTIGK